MTNFRTPKGMNRRHFMKHLADASAMVAPAMSLTHSFQVADQLCELFEG